MPADWSTTPRPVVPRAPPAHRRAGSSATESCETVDAARTVRPARLPRHSTPPRQSSPSGFGAGKLIQLAGGYTLNAYVEVQPSAYRAGVGASRIQVFTGK
jgi:hypothetical protein